MSRRRTKSKGSHVCERECACVSKCVRVRERSNNSSSEPSSKREKQASAGARELSAPLQGPAARCLERGSASARARVCANTCESIESPSLSFSASVERASAPARQTASVVGASLCLSLCLFVSLQLDASARHECKLAGLWHVVVLSRSRSLESIVVHELPSATQLASKQASECSPLEAVCALCTASAPCSSSQSRGCSFFVCLLLQKARQHVASQSQRSRGSRCARMQVQPLRATRAGEARICSGASIVRKSSCPLSDSARLAKRIVSILRVWRRALRTDWPREPRHATWLVSARAW